MICAARRDRQRHFPGALGSDACWNVLLQLYAAHIDQHRLNVGSLTKRSGVPATTVLRAIDGLSLAGFVTRHEDRFDRRRVVVELSEAGVAAMNRHLLNAGSAPFFA
ncbi:MAG TPA: MarR family winged helix-turn-helix transcriptional regulator [Sphingomicrobium sp.]|nr:MarR family winged helix-turn-helix transcriptional regulator [Sphingomicrobium sp.]